jgi:uncharacterized protein YhaN
MHIYGFGQLNNVKIPNVNDFQVCYGENEAGKSTIMAFIHGILFGFPTKQQSSDLRYEPKHDTKYGGKLRIYHVEYGHAVIERVKGKASGDVTVTLEDGTTGGEELLKQLLSNMDKGLFQAIFSFNIHGLQNIHHMKGEELGKFLFSAGTLGTERLSKTEAELQRELESRFKPSGKKPLLNEKLKEIHVLNSELKKAAAKNQQYESLVKEKESLEQEMKKMNSLVHETQERIEKLNEWMKIQSIVKEEKWIDTQINQIGEIQFPARGIERLEKLNQLIYPYNAQISSLVERIELLKNELNTIQPNYDFLDDESLIIAALDQVPLYEQLKVEKQQSETKLIEMEEKISMIKERLHLPIIEEEVLTINTNIFMKNQVEQVSRNSQKLIDVKQDLEDKFREEKNTLEDLEEKVRFAEGQMMSTQERERLEKLVSEENDKKSIEIELRAVQEKIEFYHQTNEREKKTLEKHQRQKQIQFFAIELILVVLALYGLLTRQWILGIAAVIGCLLIAVFMGKHTSQVTRINTKQSLDQLVEKEKELFGKLGSLKNSNIPVFQEQLNNDNRRKEQLNLLKMKLEQQYIQYDKIISKFEEWEIKAAENKEKVSKLSSELKIPEYIANSFFLEAFQLLEQYKIVCREKRQLLDRVENIKLEQAKITDRLNVYVSQYLSDQSYDLQKNAYLLRNKLKEEHGKLIKSQEKLAKQDDLVADLEQIKQEQTHLNTERLKLFNEANAANEEKFYEIGSRAEKKLKLIERLADLKKQLQYSIIKEDEWEKFLQIQNCEEVVSGNIREVKALAAQLVRQQEEYASIKYEIQLLEEGGSYSEVLHYFKQKKFELEEDAKEWSVYCLAQEILSRTIEKYKTVYLPRMLSKAEEYLFFLTDGNYHKIHLQKSGSGFLIERIDHTLFEANELSQATAEQVYVSIRLSLATTLYEKYRFPIIIDDSFVNFDASRTKKVLELLKKLEYNQILFFTCHHHLLQHFQKENVLYLNNGVVEVIS